MSALLLLRVVSLICRIEEAFYKKAVLYYSNKIHTTRAHKVCVRMRCSSCGG